MRYIFLYVLLTCSFMSWAQRDNAYEKLEDFTVNPMHFTTLQNPALMGSRGWLNVNQNFSNYTPQVNFSNYDYAFSFDGRIRELAFGFSGYHRAYGDQRSNTLNLGSSRVWVTESGLFTVGAAVTNTSIGYIDGDFRFQDEIDPFYGFTRPTAEENISYSAENLSLSLGGSWLYHDLYASLSVLRALRVASFYDDGMELFDSDPRGLFPAELISSFAYRQTLFSDLKLILIAEIQKAQRTDWDLSPGFNLNWQNNIFAGVSYDRLNEWRFEAGARLFDHLSIATQLALPAGDQAQEFISPTYYRFILQANL